MYLCIKIIPELMIRLTKTTTLTNGIFSQNSPNPSMLNVNYIDNSLHSVSSQ